MLDIYDEDFPPAKVTFAEMRPYLDGIVREAGVFFVKGLIVSVVMGVAYSIFVEWRSRG